jgi:hypothetical protein
MVLHENAGTISQNYCDLPGLLQRFLQVGLTGVTGKMELPYSGRMNEYFISTTKTF